MTLPRKFSPPLEENGKESLVKETKLRVESFNVLAQGLTGDSFVRCPKEALGLDRRLKEIEKDLALYSADVICLQEVDMFSHLQTVMAANGYEGIWQPKTFSPCLEFENNIGPDGSAIFYKTSQVTLLESFKGPIIVDGKPQSQVFLSCRFRTTDNIEILLVCLHLKARKENKAIRSKQMDSVLKLIREQAKESVAVIVAGDLNSDPTEPAHDLLRADNFLSTYLCVTGADPAYTTCKIRLNSEGVEETQCKTEDYIYYKNLTEPGALEVKSVLLMPDGESLGEGKLPSMAFPSDHLPQVTDFMIKS